MYKLLFKNFLKADSSGEIRRKNIFVEKIKTNSNIYDAKIITSEKEIVEFAKLAYKYQSVGMSK